MYGAHILSLPSPTPHPRLKDSLCRFLQTVSSVAPLPFEFGQCFALAKIREPEKEETRVFLPHSFSDILVS